MTGARVQPAFPLRCERCGAAEGVGVLILICIDGTIWCQRCAAAEAVGEADHFIGIDQVAQVRDHAGHAVAGFRDVEALILPLLEQYGTVNRIPVRELQRVWFSVGLLPVGREVH